MLLGHRNITLSNMFSNVRCSAELDTEGHHEEKADDVDDCNLGSQLMLAENTSEDSKQFEGPPLSTLHHRAWYAKSEELLATLPIE